MNAQALLTYINENELNKNNTLGNIEANHIDKNGLEFNPLIIFDLLTALNKVKNDLSKNIKKYISSREALLIEYDEHKIYLNTYKENINKINTSADDMETTINLSLDLIQSEAENKTEPLIKLINCLKISFDIYLKCFIETREHFKAFQKDHTQFKGYNTINRLFEIEINEKNINKIYNILNRMKSNNYIFNLIDNSKKELRRVKNNYERRFKEVFNLTYNNRLSNIILSHVEKFKNVFKYKLFIMEVLNLKFYLDRVESFETFEEYEINENDKTLNLIPLEERKINEYVYLNEYQNGPAHEETFKENGIFENILFVLNNFYENIIFINNNYEDNKKFKELEQRLKETKEHLKAIFKTVPGGLTFKEGKEINKNGEIYLNNMINNLNKINGINIDKNKFLVMYNYDIDKRVLKENEQN
jgi:hypothetical protein